MTEVAIAVVLSFDPVKKQTFYTEYRSDEGQEDPLSAAHALRESCEPDFPDNWLWVATGNDAAAEIRSKRMMKAMGFDE